MATESLALTDLPGVGENTAEKLRNGGFETIAQIASVSAADLIQASGIGEKTAIKIVQIAKDILGGNYVVVKGVDSRETEIKTTQKKIITPEE